MRTIVAQVLIIVLFEFSLSAQYIEYARKTVDTLSSPYFAGRGYVNDGLSKAASYLSNEFKAIGLKSFKKKYAQEFTVAVNTFPGRLLLKLDDSLLVPGKDYLVDPLSSSVVGNFELLTISKSQLSDLAVFQKLIADASNKMVLLDECNYKASDNETEKKIQERVNYLKYNPQFGSKGTIVLSTAKLSWYPASIQMSKPVFIVKSDSGNFFPKKAEVFIQAEYRPKYTTENIIGYVPGTVYPDSFLVITAHYDHLGKLGSNVYFPGANDNSSGVAMMLSLAKYFKANPAKYSVVFIALSAEEIGLLGAKYFSENPLFDLSKAKFLINFDLAGTGEEGIKVVNGTVYQKEFNLLSDLNISGNYLASVQVRGEACISDHCMFYKKGVPCFYMYTLGGISAYHDIYDRAETLPLTAFDNYFKLMTKFFEAL